MSGRLRRPRVAVLGLGEAGARLAADLSAAGCAVAGWDPRVRPPQVPCAADAREAAAGADVVLSVNSAAVALQVAEEVAPVLQPTSLYADMNTSPPELKRQLASIVPSTFVDVALVGVVPESGLRTPALASGSGAAEFATMFGALGMPVEVVGLAPGDATQLKLVRSVFMKGLAAAVLEAVEAARAIDAEDRLRADVAQVIGKPLLDRLLAGSHTHAERRAEEMRAASELLQQLGVEPHVATAATSRLDALR